MKAQNLSENMRLYNKCIRRVKALIKTSNTVRRKNIAAESKHVAKMFLGVSITRSILEVGWNRYICIYILD